MASFDIFALSPQGYEVHVQIQGEDPGLYQVFMSTLARMDKDGFRPRAASQPQKPGANGNGNAAPARPDPYQCPTHGRAKESRSGGLYCPTKLPDGTFCTWTAKTMP